MPIIYAVILISIGMLELILSIVNLGLVVKVVSIAIACALFVIGLIHIVTSLVVNTKDFFKAELVLGAIAIAIGIILCIETGLIASFLVYLVASFLLSFGTICIVKAVLAFVYHYKTSWKVAYILFAVLAITGGVLALVFRGESAQTIYCVIGGTIFIIGVLELVYGIQTLSKK